MPLPGRYGPPPVPPPDPGPTPLPSPSPTPVPLPVPAPPPAPGPWLGVSTGVSVSTPTRFLLSAGAVMIGATTAGNGSGLSGGFGFRFGAFLGPPHRAGSPPPRGRGP